MKGKTKYTNLLAMVLALFLFTVALSACSPASTPTATQMPEQTLTSLPNGGLVSSTPTATQMPEQTLASLPDGGLVYGDPKGRFSLPLVGEWAPAESDGSYARFTLADPALELHVVAIESGELEAGVQAALTEIGVDTQALSPVDSGYFEPWNLYLYLFEDGQSGGIAAQVLDDVTVAIIVTAESSVLSPAPAQFWATIEGFATLPLAEYLEFLPPPAPTTAKDIEDLSTIEFYSGRTRLVGQLVLPEGEGPFPAIVYTGGGSGRTTRSQYYLDHLRDAGLAIFSYDKRGAGDSEGWFVEVGIETGGEWRLVQLADDALAAVAFLQGLEEIHTDQIGLMGVSQNGWTIPLAAARSDAVAFTVIVAGPTVSLGEEVYWSKLSGGASTVSESKREGLAEQLAAFDGLRSFDPRPHIEAMSIPGLWIWGDLDGSIPARESKAILESIIEQYDKDFTILYYPDAGHGVSADRPEVDEWVLAQVEE